MTLQVVVSDSSTLILLVKAGLVDTLTRRSLVFIPKVVFEECVILGKGKGRWDAFLIEQLADRQQVKIKDPSKKILERISADFNLHRGERHAIALALELNAEFLLTDDYKAMNACKVLGIRFVNAVSLLLALHEKGVLGEKPALLALEKLSEFGWYAPAIILNIRQKIGEVKK
ncbi:MAG: hypothetical protein HY917_05430 [Candidatus Diapherotrites archaeon]|nr:hypothetical protein [Candidatus Diapherotrites archaeon]